MSRGLTRGTTCRMQVQATVRLPSGVLRHGPRRALSRTQRGVPAAAAPHVLMTMLTRVTMERQFRDAGSAANAALALIAVATALLDRQLAAQATAFEREGGFSERLHRVRSARRSGPA